MHILEIAALLFPRAQALPGALNDCRVEYLQHFIFYGLFEEHVDSYLYIGQLAPAVPGSGGRRKLQEPKKLIRVKIWDPISPVQPSHLAE